METHSLYELQQSINEKLSDIAKDHTGVSPGKMHGMRIRLQDAKGIFLDLVLKEPKRNPPDKQQDDAAGNKGEEDFEILWMTLKVTLQAEVSTLKEALASENERVREMLGMNCMQLSEFDVTLTAKDEEVARLKGQLA